MANIVCYDSGGQILRYYTQWDVSQKLVIKGADTSSAPSFHFLNAYISTAYVVQSEISGNSITADVPDIMLQYDVPVIVYIYYTEGTTEYSVRIPVMPRIKPSGYVDYNPGAGGGSSGSSGGNITIADNLTTDNPNYALSAAQGVVIKAMLDNKLGQDNLQSSIDSALSQAKESGEFNGESGRGIVSIKRTAGTGAAGTTDTYTITYTDSTTSTFNVYNGANGSGGGDGAGGSGEDGATFTPSVDSDGNLSWSNNKGLANPDMVNIKGPKGDKGDTGDTGPTGTTGATGAKGADGKTPVKGTDYWTEEDKAEMVSAVLEALPAAEGGTY